mgnify:CR=1 FL=1
MNELDLKTKIEGLEKAIKEHDDMSIAYKNNLKEIQKELDDYNKPELTPMQFDDIQEAIEKAVNNYDFNDSDNYEVEYGIDYDGKVHLQSIDLSCNYELIEMIVEKVHNLFKEADCPSDEENARDDREAEQVADQINKQTVAKKII